MGRVFLLVLFLMPLACKRKPTPAPPPPMPAATIPILNVQSLIPLVPGRPTHLAVAPRQQFYWVQESTTGDDTVIGLDSRMIPQATDLTAGKILSELGASSGTGNIQSLVWADDQLYFYFLGGQNARVIACLGRFSPSTGRIRILANTESLDQATGMGPSLALARARIIATDGPWWLWLRHTDRSILLRFDPASLAPASPIEFHQPFATIQSPDGPLTMTLPQMHLSAGGDGRLLLTDLHSATLWTIDRSGQATNTLSLVGLSSGLSTPAVDPKLGFIFFAAAADPMSALTIDRIAEPPVRTSYPALLMLNTDHWAAIDRQHFHVTGNLDPSTMQIEQLYPDPSQQGYLAYDNASGHLLLLKITQ
ncbi:MAG: hypothetical protein IT446_01115 [Phycisphaerales bacterium]|nr:hypothetical protein [Phycisphaerales bacterium]